MLLMAYISFLLMHNKLPQMKWLKTILIYYLSSVGQKLGWAWWGSLLRIKTLTKLCSDL